MLGRSNRLKSLLSALSTFSFSFGCHEQEKIWTSQRGLAGVAKNRRHLFHCQKEIQFSSGASSNFQSNLGTSKVTAVGKRIFERVSA